MRILAMDTATRQTVVALLEDRQVLGEISELSKNHSVTLLPAIDRLLTDLGTNRSQVEAVAVGVGPGSFTGLRVGLAMAKTMAFALDIPLVGVSTLTALASNGQGAGVDRVCPVLDALKKEVYCAAFHFNGDDLVQTQPEDARKPEAFAEELAKLPGKSLLLGNGAQRYRQVFHEALGDAAVFPEEEACHQVQAGSIGRLGLKRLETGERDDPYTLEPRYHRLSEAELARMK